MSQHDPQRLVDAAEPGDRQTAELLARLGGPARDDLARERVWRRLEAARTQPQQLPWFRMALAAAASAAMVFLIWRALPTRLAPQAMLALTAGEVWTSIPPQPEQVAHASQVIAPGERLRTSAGAHAALELGRAVLALDGDSALVLDSPTRVRLTMGALAMRSSSGVVIQVGEHVVRGDDSAFSVRTDVAGETVIDVNDGAVDVSRGDLRWRIVAGQHWRSDAPDAAVAGGVAAELVSVLGAVGAPGTRGELHVDGDRSFRVSIDGAALGPAPTTILASEGAHRISAESSAGKVELEARVRSGEPSVVHLAAHAAPVKVEPAPVVKPEVTQIEAQPKPLVVARAPKLEHVAPHVEVPHLEPARVEAEMKSLVVETPPAPAPIIAPTPKPETPVIVRAEPTPMAPIDRYAHALELAQQGHAREAATLLSQVVDAKEPRADLALYELGRLRQRSLNDLPGALDAFTRYRSSFPRGALGQEVAISTIEVELAMQKQGAALDSLDDFLSRYPNNERAHEMRLLRANLHRDRHDWDDAIADYRQLEGTPSAAEALFFTAFCQRQSGDLAGAEVSLRGYLQRYPQGPRRAEVEQALGQ